MKLVTEEIKKKLPQLYSTENETDPIAQVKFFTPDSQWTWYVVEYDGDDLFFGLVIGFARELGYFRLSELESIKGPYGLKVERDLYFEPKPVSQCGLR
jgi:hypothetical protein